MRVNHRTAGAFGGKPVHRALVHDRAVRVFREFGAKGA